MSARICRAGRGVMLLFFAAARDFRLLGLLQRRQGVVVGDEVEAVALVLQVDVLLDRAEVVAEVQLAGRLHAAEDARARIETAHRRHSRTREAPTRRRHGWAFLHRTDTVTVRPVRSASHG